MPGVQTGGDKERTTRSFTLAPQRQAKLEDAAAIRVQSFFRGWRARSLAQGAGCKDEERETEDKRVAKASTSSRRSRR
eukprot:9716215-Prorocentrum_lima.AAC.1